MRRYLIGLAGAALLIATAAAATADNSLVKRGTVRWVDYDRNTIGLDDGTRFRAAEGVDVRGLAPGSEADFHYHRMRSGDVVVSYAPVGYRFAVDPRPTTPVTQPGSTVPWQMPNEVVIITPNGASAVITSTPGSTIIAEGGQTVITSYPYAAPQPYWDTRIFP